MTNVLAIYVAHRGALVNYASGILGDSARAEDVVQEAFLRFRSAASRRAATGALFDEPVAYLYRIVRNLALDGYRRKTIEEQYVDPHAGDEIEAIAENRSTPEESLIARQELQNVLAAMEELPERTRIALEMRRFGGYKLKKIAEHLNLSIPQTHEIIAQGIAHCRRKVRSGS